MGGLQNSTSVITSSKRDFRKSRFRKLLRNREYRYAVLFLAPALLFLMIFIYLPTLVAFVIAFFHYHLGSSQQQFAGISNFRDALSLNVFQKSILNSILFAAMQVPAILVLSICVALLINHSSRYYNFIRTLILLPYATPAVGTAIGWLWIFNPTYGLANGVLHWLGLPTSQWLQSPTMALPSIAIYSVWHGVGFDVVIVLSALGTLPRAAVEAAIVDGASAWTRFWKITFPLISPTVFFLLIVTTIGSLQSFSQIYALSGGSGGPEYATTTTLLLIYETAFKYNHLSYGSAMAIFLVIIILLFTLIQRWASKRYVYYQ
ncbi:carbohydrate ABC transporter permease [Alicyclobacillus sp. SO9]|uniref:carbohydrate ABC transporter permease n=1 Tax=Alicyclobacillus sp. SO9 TaxID=2665646 RepID=UPI0018E76A08|nr:sugar ABC transporter permease [Alicyclobacillus sp. SO9]QQE79151.1 sugar ABC transporter permease [Alicyclobacillus sp. SO9]